MPADTDFNTVLKLDLLASESPAVGLTDEREQGWTGRYCAIDANQITSIEDIASIQALTSDEIFISQPFEGRPDLLANDLYGNPELSWILKLANNLPRNEDFKTSLRIRVPNRRDVEALFLVNGRNRN